MQLGGLEVGYSVQDVTELVGETYVLVMILDPMEIKLRNHVTRDKRFEWPE